MRDFNILLLNHPFPSWYQLCDLVRPIVAGITDLGGNIQVNGTVMPRSVQIFIEYFTSDLALDIVSKVKDVGTVLGLVLTEDPREVMANPALEGRWNYLQKALPCFDFFWDFTPQGLWTPHLPSTRIAHPQVGSYNDRNRTLQARKKFKPTLDFLFYGRPTFYRELWRGNLTGRGFASEYSLSNIINSQIMAMPEYLSESIVGSSAVLLDVPREQNVTMPSFTRLAYALQNGLPLISDSKIDFENTCYHGYVETASLEQILGNLAWYLSENFRAKAQIQGENWRERFPMSKFMESALQVVDA